VIRPHFLHITESIANSVVGTSTIGGAEHDNDLVRPRRIGYREVDRKKVGARAFYYAR
jgi:hypothetical protein